MIGVGVGGVRGPARPTGWAGRRSERPTDGEPGAALAALVEPRQVHEGLVCVRGRHVGAVEVKGCGRGTRFCLPGPRAATPEPRGAETTSLTLPGTLCHRAKIGLVCGLSF